MTEQNAFHHPHNAWILVADSETAQVYRYGKHDRAISLNSSRKISSYREFSEHALVPLEDMHFRSENLGDYQIGHQRRGTVSAMGSTARNTYESSGDTGGELQRRFLHAIADRLAEAHRRKDFESLILVAPAKTLGELREQLPPALRQCVTATLSKDLAGRTPQDVLVHLEGAISEARIA